MKIIIDSYGEVLAEFDPAEVDNIGVSRYFDVEQANKRSNPHVAYLNHFKRPIPKTGRIICVTIVSGEYADIHLFDPDNCCVTFK